MWNITRPVLIASASIWMTRRGPRGERNSRPPCLFLSRAFPYQCSHPSCHCLYIWYADSRCKGNRCFELVLLFYSVPSCGKKCSKKLSEATFEWPIFHFFAQLCFLFFIFPCFSANCENSAWNTTYLGHFFHCLHYRACSFCRWNEVDCTKTVKAVHLDT